ncbi:Levodione reductase [compost metagenome]
MSMKFSGQVALVTGAAGGIGRAVALAFAAEGLKVVVSDVDGNGGEATVEMIRSAGGEATFVRCNVVSGDEVKALVEQTVATYGRLDYAVNNAGIEGRKDRLPTFEESEFDAIMDVNVKGVWQCLKHQLPVMAAQGGGAIVNTASVAGIRGVKNMSIYSASKHAVIGLSKSAAVEFARKGVRVNAVCPGLIETDMGLRVIDGAVDKAAYHPAGRLGRPQEIADAVLYLCSDNASFTMGHAMVVDGAISAA